MRARVVSLDAPGSWGQETRHNPADRLQLKKTGG